MSKAISFSEEISNLEQAIIQHEQDLTELEERHSQFDVQTHDARRVLGELRESFGMPSNRTTKGGGRAGSKLRSVSALETNPESGRPARGARRAQIEAICRALGQAQGEFRTAEVIDQIRDLEGELSGSLRSYIYALMTTLETETILEKVGHGRWKVIG